MKFFTHFYLENHMYFNDYLKYVLIFAALVVLLLAVITDSFLNPRNEETAQQGDI